MVRLLSHGCGGHRFAVATCTVLLLAACKSEQGGDHASQRAPAGMDDIQLEAPPHFPANLRRPDSEVRFYVDLSGTMQGFDGENGGALFSWLASCKEALYSEGFYMIQAAGFADTVDAFRNITGLVEILDWTANRANTCLAAPYTHETALQRDGGDSALSLVLTDGVASAAGVACGQTCASGGDITCVAESARRYIELGHGLWVVGVKVPFHGPYYPEIGTVRELSVVDRAATRPIYLWIGSSDLAMGRRLAAAFALNAGGVGVERLVFEVWPGAWAGWVSSPVSGAWNAAEFLPRRGTGGPCESGSNLQFMTTRTGDSCPIITLLSEGSNWQPGWQWPLRLPIKRTRDAPPAPIRALVSINAKWPPVIVNGRLTTTPDSTAVELSGCLVTENRRVAMRLAWMGDHDASMLRPWSTEDDSGLEHIGRTLNLESLWGLTAKRLADEATRSVLSNLLVIEIDPDGK